VGAKLETHQARDGSTYYPYRPVVRFGAPGGRQVVFTSALGSQAEPDPGTSVPVRYRLAGVRRARPARPAGHARPGRAQGRGLDLLT
ncbi:MAG TPA: hypothetical protein VFD04_18215, partial [Actinomycetes bacterium]|nr:hypothetical protein [Actinomycetes bacterium]